MREPVLSLIADGSMANGPLANCREHGTVPLANLSDRDQQDRQAARAAEHGRSRNVLLKQIMSQLHGRPGARTGSLPRSVSSGSEGDRRLCPRHAGRRLVVQPGSAHVDGW